MQQDSAGWTKTLRETLSRTQHAWQALPLCAQLNPFFSCVSADDSAAMQVFAKSGCTNGESHHPEICFLLREMFRSCSALCAWERSCFFAEVYFLSSASSEEVPAATLQVRIPGPRSTLRQSRLQKSGPSGTSANAWPRCWTRSYSFQRARVQATNLACTAGVRQ